MYLIRTVFANNFNYNTSPWFTGSIVHLSFWCLIVRISLQYNHKFDRKSLTIIERLLKWIIRKIKKLINITTELIALIYLSKLLDGSCGYMIAKKQHEHSFVGLSLFDKKVRIRFHFYEHVFSDYSACSIVSRVKRIIIHIFVQSLIIFLIHKKLNLDMRFRVLLQPINYCSNTNKNVKQKQL